MKIVKNIMSKVFVVFVAMSQVLPTSTISTYAETTSHKLTVQVVGEANVTMSTSDDVAYGVTAEEKLVHEFEDGTELKFNILSDNGITSINEDGVAVTDSQGQALTDYENNTDYDFTYTTKAKDSTIVITVNEAESTDESKEKEETKDASSDTDKSDSKDESKDDSKSEEKKDETSKKAKGLNIDFSRTELTHEEQAILDDYKNDLYDEHKEERKAKAESAGLEKYVDDDYFINSAYLKKYDIRMLGFDGLEILNPYLYGSRAQNLIDVGSVFANSNSRSGGLTVTGETMSIVYEAGTGYRLTNGKWTLSNGSTAFCAVGLGSSPVAGDTTEAPYVVDNANLRKVLYYGYAGPQSDVLYNYLTTLGLVQTSDNITAGSIAITSELSSQAYSGYCNAQDSSTNGYWWNKYLSNIWNYLTSLPDPGSVFKVYGAQVNGTAENWKGDVTQKQFLVYGVYSPKGNLTLKKTSKNPSITNNNSCYSLKGAVYGVYSDSVCTNKVATLTTDENGSSNTVELDAGTYYVKETTAPKGYALDTQTHNVTVNADKTETISLSDTPQADPIGILVGKVDAYTNKNKPQGSASLEGAEFRVRYYDGQYSSDPAKQGVSYKAEWVLKTDSDGYCYLSADYLVSGSSFYFNNTNEATLPLGTVTIEEYKAPTGYQRDETVYVRNITTEGSTESVTTYNAPTIKEESYYGSFQLTKFFTDAEQSEVVTPEVGAKFVAVLESYYNQANGDINQALALAKENGSDREYSEITTDSDGVGKSGKLAYGTYIVVQTSTGTNATETYEVAPFKFIVSNQNENPYVYGELDNGTQISASSDGTVHYLINNKPVTSGVKIVKKDKDTGKTVTLNNASFKIKKLDADGNVVTNYSKPTIRTDENGYISMKVGTKWYDTFVTNADNRLSFVDNVANLFGKTYEANASEEKGSVALPIALEYGNYQIEELNAPKGYLLTNNGKFTISKSNVTGTDDDGQPLINIVMSDEKPTGQVTLKKKFNSSKKMHGTVSFNLIATEDIKDASDGSIIYAKGDVVGTYNLDESNDTIVVGNLPLQDGKASYKFVEVSTYENYKLNTNEYPFSFEIQDQTTKKYTAEVEVENEIITIKTKAINAKTEEKEFNASSEIYVTDIVSYDGLVEGKEYTMYATLVDKETGEAVTDKDGNVVEGFKRFTATGVTGDVKVKLTLDSSKLGGKEYVVYETLYNTSEEGHEGCAIASHKDVTDEDQTITILDTKIGTTAKSTNGTHEQQVVDGKLTLTDTVKYENLVTNQNYKLSGVLMNKETGEAIVDEEGNKITSETTFIPDTTDGTVDVTFKFDASNIKAGTETVVFETLYEIDTDTEGVTKIIEVANHKDINDEGQSIDFIDIHTTAVSDNGTHEQQLKDEITLTDTVAYEGLKVGKEYTVQGTLMNKVTSFALTDKDGNEISAETTFTPTSANGTVDVVFTFDGSLVKTKDSIVVFEDLFRNDVTIATHSDIEDKDQTIDIIDIHTTAVSEKDNHTALAGEEVTITDTVKYEGLKVGKEYTVKGVLMDKETGEAIVDEEGNKITSETTFIPDTTDGTVDVVFTLDSSKLAGKTVVVFEDLYRDDVKVATHSDIEDEDQSVTFKDYEIQVNKVDSITKKNITSKDFEFTMYKDSDCKDAVKTVAGDKDKGTATFSVTKGTWYIKESKAPQGYKLSNEVVKVEVKDDKMYVNDKEVDTDSDYLYSIIYQDALLPSIKKVKTGSENGMTMYVMTGMIALIVCAILVFLKRRNANKV